MLQSDRYEQNLHDLNARNGTATMDGERDDRMSPSDRLAAALRKQIELDNEEPERWDGLS